MLTKKHSCLLVGLRIYIAIKLYRFLTMKMQLCLSMLVVKPVCPSVTELTKFHSVYIYALIVYT